MRSFRAPGRVNLCGEHTDYNDGYVLPVALDMDCVVHAKPNEDGEIRISSSSFGGVESVDAESLSKRRPRNDWTDYAVGVAKELANAGVPITAADLHVESAIPVGAGLASSAAFEVAFAQALMGLSETSLPRAEVAKLCQAAEKDFVGMQCGIMDQFVALFGSAGTAVLLDCRSLEHQSVWLPKGISIVVVNSGVRHELASSAYNERVRECSEACALLSVESLRDIAAGDWERVEKELAEPPRRRVRHVVFENQRVLDFVAACERSDLDSLGAIMSAGHRSLAVDYQVSCPELDFLVEVASSIDGVVGSRMTGGGFGGCTVNLVCDTEVEHVEAQVSDLYALRFGVVPEIYRCKPSDGAGEVSRFDPT